MRSTVSSCVMLASWKWVWMPFAGQAADVLLDPLGTRPGMVISRYAR
jgi:hypothetical protein